MLVGGDERGGMDDMLRAMFCFSGGEAVLYD